MTLLTPELLDTKTYGFEKLRYLLQSLGIQEGVVDANDLKVVQRAAGANMSVDVGAGRTFIQGDSGTRNGLYHLVNDATINVVVTAAHATNPRIDQVVAEIHDSSDLGSADDTPQLYVLAGTPTAGATLDNRNGAAALPNNAVRLADILVPAASSTVVTANIRDRRPWARGAYRQAVLSAAATTTLTAAPGAQVDATNGTFSLECSGVPIRARMFIGLRSNAAAGTTLLTALYVDDVSTAIAQQQQGFASGNTLVPVEAYLTPAPGRRKFDWRMWAAAAGTLSIIAGPSMHVEELVNQDSVNV